MWEEGVRIYGTPGVHNNFPGFRLNKIYPEEMLESEVERTQLSNSIRMQLSWLITPCSLRVILTY